VRKLVVLVEEIIEVAGKRTAPQNGSAWDDRRIAAERIVQTDDGSSTADVIATVAGKDLHTPPTHCRSPLTRVRATVASVALHHVRPISPQRGSALANGPTVHRARTIPPDISSMRTIGRDRSG
jgi:hypothetical protein